LAAANESTDFPGYVNFLFWTYAPTVGVTYMKYSHIHLQAYVNNSRTDKFTASHIRLPRSKSKSNILWNVFLLSGSRTIMHVLQ